MRRALEATEFTDLGINLTFLEAVTLFLYRVLQTAFQLNILLQDQEFLESCDIRLLDEGEVVEIPLLLLGLLGEDVAVVSVFPLDLSRSGKREALFGTGVGLELCHC